MQIQIENFGKIKSANVVLDGYTIFIGDNNSGKTYLMQLIYGVLDALARIVFPKGTSPSSVCASEVKQVVNNWLTQNKEKIVSDTFKKNIPIGRLEIIFEPSEKVFSVKKISKDEYARLRGGDVPFPRDIDEKSQIISIFEDDAMKNSFLGFDDSQESQRFISKEMLRFAVRRLLGLFDIRRESNIFLPASRSGLMLTRPFVFANRVADRLIPAEQILSARKRENEFGLTQPIDDFLNFLQTHKVSEHKTRHFSQLISFINKNIIHGEMKKTDNESFYKPDGLDEWLPPSITSSMVNEISPILQILTSVRGFQYIFYDEIETCQHPTTQIQMARLLNRMVNAGYKMVVSTHSDTMAAAISNLVALSFVDDKERKCAKLRYEKEDLLKNDSVHAYQFLKDEDGLSVVTEVEKFNNLGMGYDFSLFSQVSKNIFETAKIIYE